MPCKGLFWGWSWNQYLIILGHIIKQTLADPVCNSMDCYGCERTHRAPFRYCHCCHALPFKTGTHQTLTFLGCTWGWGTFISQRWYMYKMNPWLKSFVSFTCTTNEASKDSPSKKKHIHIPSTEARFREIPTMSLEICTWHETGPKKQSADVWILIRPKTWTMGSTNSTQPTRAINKCYPWLGFPPPIQLTWNLQMPPERNPGG